MNTTIEPYLFFDGNCEEAVTFYQTHLGAKVEMMMRYKESPDPIPEGMVPKGWDEKVMHVSLTVGESRIMASDSGGGSGCGEKGGEPPKFSGFSLSLAPEDEAEAKRLFEVLSEGGEVEMPLGETFWSPCFGTLTDRFGLGWMISVTPEDRT